MSTRLFVGNLSYSTTEEQIREAFSRSGRTVESIRIALDRETQRPRGFAFVDMVSDPDADSAIQELHNQPLAGRTIFVEKAQERVPGAPRPASSRPPFQRPAGDRPVGDRPPGGGFQNGRPRSFSTPGNSSGPPGGPRRPSPLLMSRMEPEKEGGRRHKVKPNRKEKEKKNPGRPEQRERGKWRWDGQEDY